MDLEGKRALVTGGGRRVGRALCVALAERGVHVAVHYDASEAAAVEVAAACGGAPLLHADLTVAGAARGLVHAAQDALGGLDLLINNAAVYKRTPLETVDERAWNRNLDLNLKAAFFAAQAAGRIMREGAGGVILNLTDAQALDPRPGYLPYFASKAGLEAVTRGLALELAPEVRVNAVAPGPVMAPEDASEASIEAIRRATPLDPAGAIESLVSAVFYLIESDFVTGQTLTVDGGRSLR